MSKLSGQRILITRAKEDCASWAAQLKRLGAIPVIFPCIECKAIETGKLRAKLARELPQTHWLVFTSRRGVDAFTTLHDKPLAEKLKVSVVGPATAQIARTRLGRVDFISENGTAASLGEELGEKIASPSRLLIAVAENADEKLENALSSAGKECVRLDLYRTMPKKVQTPRKTVSSLSATNIFFASPSAVTGLINQVELDATPHIFTIGPSTTASVRAAGLKVTGEANQSNLQGLLEAFICAN